MYIQRLNIFGFKSFAKKVVLDFMPGITGVVGPNGCGKSNVVDAIRWVLGEQRAGMLRSDRMENVIFNGSKNLKPLGMAEVSLVIHNTQKVLPVEYSEVMITRRLFRSGESQYLINNNPCRLKDITDLLMDTGLTPDAYSVIELSMVESILNGKPEDRRRIFEEAVGISKYKQRRKLTLRKLDATEQDLVRLADIITEVQSKVNSLHRQVRRAQRYQELAQELKETELRVATFHFNRIYDELGPLSQSYESLSRNRESLTSQISFKEAEVEAFQTDLLQLEEQLRQAQNSLNQKLDTIRKREEEILLSRERLKSLANNKVRIESEVESLKTRIDNHQKQRIEIEQQLAKLAETLHTARQAFEQAQAALKSLDEQIAEQKKKNQQAEQQLRQQMQSLSEQQRSIERLASQLDHLKAQKASLVSEQQQLAGKIEQLEQQRKQLAAEEERLRADLDELVETQAQLEGEAEQVQEQIDRAKDEILKTNAEIGRLQQRVVFIKELLEKYAGYPPGIKYLMDRLGQAKGIYTTLAEAITVDDNYRRAIELALGEQATYVLVADDHAAYLGINELREHQQGIVTFVPLERLAENTSTKPLPSDAGVIGWAADLVSCPSQFRPAIQLMLGRYLIVSDRSVADRLLQSESGKDIHFVTLSGELIFNWGGIKGGQKQSESESIIGRYDQIRKLQQQIDEMQQRLSSLERTLRSHEAQRVELQRRRSELANQVKRVQQQLSDTELKRAQVQYQIGQANERHDFCLHQQRQIEAEMEQHEQQHQQLSQTHVARQEHYELLNQQFQGHRQEIDQILELRNQQSAKVNQLNLTVVELTGNERNLNREYDQAQLLIDEYTKTIQRHEQELADIANQRAQLEGRIEELSELVTQDYAEKESEEAKVTEIESRYRALRDNVDEKARAISQLRKERETVAEQLHQIELRKSELRINADNLYHRIMEEYDVELKRAPIDPSYDVTVDETQVNALREKIKSLGPVNLLALKEYEEEKNRLDFLQKQHEDLIAAEQNLKETIAHINETAQQKFNTVFQEIRANFIKVFRQFFPEGDADLIIAPDEDPLEASIEIKANPKSKRMESLTLLSTGEKALTAISLLFGIYLVKPSPICILDEVDAPLDDNNVIRFIHAIRQFASTTQFIIVTHNKLTMKSADCLYGVTMEESGVSKIVSVKLE